MELLAELGFRAVDVVELARRLDSPAGLVGLSFDDAYLDVVENALPVLERHGFTASVFVVTAVTSGDATFTWYARQPPLIPWSAIVELDGGSPLRFEAHTRTHPNLQQIDDARARDEIAGGKRELEDRLGREVEAFCYPAGLVGARERALVAEAGFATAVTCEPGVNTLLTDPLLLNRMHVDARDSLLDVRAKLLGGHDTPLPLRDTWRRVRYGASTSS
jgi:peptidoglycan/xylan/chitin deacetylase (PgdA/CDA1 family)